MPTPSRGHGTQIPNAEAILRRRLTLPPRLLLALAIGLLLPQAFDQRPASGAEPPASAAANPAANGAKDGSTRDAAGNGVDANQSAGPANPVQLPAVRSTAPVAPPSAGDPGGAADSAPAVASTASPDVVNEVKPQVYYVRDKDGRLIPVPGFSYEDFVRYYRLKEQLDRPETPPQYSLQQMTLTGASHGDRVELTAIFKVLLNVSSWVRVPLRLNQCVLRGSAEFKGGGEEFLQFDPAGDGYICWIRSPAHTESELTLKVLAPLATSAEENRLDLNLPRAAVSKLTVHVPSAGAMATASPGAAPPEVAPANPPSAGSDISLLGVGGDCWLAWRESDQPVARLSSALEATGAILVRIDGRSVNSDATLSVRSFGAAFDHFRVRLPPGAELVGGRQDGYTLTAGNGPTAGQVEVKLDHKTTGPIDVRLSTERAYDVTTSKPEPLELAGFDVVEAIAHRQWGYLAVAVAGDWQLVWGEQNRMRQVSELPDNLRRKDLVAGFEYFGQPNSLVVRVVPRKTRISVEPQYVYNVSDDEVRLDARLDYTIRGAKLFKLDIDLPGWELDKVRPEGLIDVGSISTSPAGLITLPLVEPATGEIELAITAHRRNTPLSKTIAWTLPQPRVDVAGPAEVAIVPADNIELTPRPAEISGLGRSTGEGIHLRAAVGIPPAAGTGSPGEAASPAGTVLPAATASSTGAGSPAGAAPANPSEPISLSPSGEPPVPPALSLRGGPSEIELSPTALFYRAEQSEAKFAADFAVRQQDVSVELDNQVSIRDRDVSVVQAIDYTVRYVPLERLRLNVPRELLEQHKLKFVVGGVTLQPQEAPAKIGSDRMDIELALPRPILGAFHLEVAYAIPAPRPAASASAPLDLPLAVPRDGSIANNSATISAPSYIRIEQRDSPWNTVDSPPAGPGAEQPLRLTASDAAEELPLAISRDDGRLQSATFVDRAWIQTWLTESVRQDRIVYLFTSNEDQLRLELPAGISATDVELTLDGRPLAPVAGQSGSLLVVLPPDAERREHLLQLRYQFDGRGPHSGSLVLDAPKWDNHVTIRRTYWQLLLPADELVLKASGDLSSEYDWVWNAGYFGLRRVPLKDAAQLEQWVGLGQFTGTDDALPSSAAIRAAESPERFENVNRYLFSTAGQEGRFDVVVVRRWLLLLIASAGALAIGLAMIYFPALRQIRVIVVAVALAIIAVVIYPDPALLIAQAGSLGLVLIFAALLLRWLVNRRPAPVSSAPLSSSSRLERSSTRLYPRREQLPEPATTATSPIAVDVPSRSHL